MLKKYKLILLIFFALVLLISFVHGWYFDLSKPLSGIGWADQTYYYKVTEKLATGVSLLRSDFHYQLGYSLLGALFFHIVPSDPFMPVSFLLLMVSMVFLYYGAQTHFNTFFALLFLTVTYFRMGNVRALYYAQEVF